MARPVEFLGELAVTAEKGEQLRIEGRGDSIAIILPNLWTGRLLARQAPGRSKRQLAISRLQKILQRADLVLQVEIANKPIAYLSPHSRITFLSRLLGLGALELKPLALFVAVFRR